MSTGSTAELNLDRTTLVAWTVAAVGGTAFTAAAHEDLLAILLGGAVFAVARVWRVPSPSGDTLDIGLAVAAAVPLLTNSIAVVGAVYAWGLLVSWLLLMGRRSEVSSMFVANALGLTAYGVTFIGIHAAADVAFAHAVSNLLGIAGAALVWFVVTAVVRAVAAYGHAGYGFRYVWLLTLSDWPVGVALVASGGLFALSWPHLRWWALPMAGMSYGFSHLAFVRYAGTRTTYGQTIKALARIPEMAELAPQGHAVRTAETALAMGRDLGLSPGQLTELEYGALMHDIGRITLNEPAVIKAGYTDIDIARWGAEIISEAPYLMRVAQAVRQQPEPYRRPGQETDESLPIASKIIKVASAFDQAVNETGLAPVEAVEILHRGAAYDFDPGIVRSLRRVLVREGDIVA